MCNRYVAPDQAAIERHWGVGRSQPWRAAGVYPRSLGPFLRMARDGSQLDLVVGQWGLIPWFAKSPKLPYSTNNARSEELGAKASFKVPWARGQRCIIPAESFDEPCWETGSNVWWTFRRADDALWGLAGLWNTWTDKASGELVESYTMLTVNADEHPVMARMHKPDPKKGPDEQDKRSVVAIELANMKQWLCGSLTDAAALLQPPSADLLVARPADRSPI